MIKRISLSEAIEYCGDINQLLFGNNQAILKKDSDSITREFDKDKYYPLLKYFQETSICNMQDIENLADGSQDLHAFYNGDHCVCSASFIRNYLKHVLTKQISKELKTNDYDKLIELGSGYGSKIIHIASELKGKTNDRTKYYACDISRNGLKLAEELGKIKGIDIKTIQHDLRKTTLPESFGCDSGLLLTCFGLHYLKQFRVENIKEWTVRGIKMGIHYEPCTDLLARIDDKLYGLLCLKYCTQNDYTKNIANTFMDAQKQGLIELEVHSNPCGWGFLPAWLITWRALSQ